MTQQPDPNGYTEADVRALADILADAAMRGIRYGTATLARTILDAGWRRPPAAIVDANDDEHTDEEQRYPEGRPYWLGEYQPWPCERCGTEVDAHELHRCVPVPSPQNGGQ